MLRRWWRWLDEDLPIILLVGVVRLALRAAGRLAAPSSKQVAQPGGDE